MQINMFDAKSQLSKLVEAALAGDEVVLARNGKPVARIIAYRPAPVRRKPGALKGLIRLTPGWDSPEFNRQLAEELAAQPLEPAQDAVPQVRQPRAGYRMSRRRRRR